MKHDIAICGFGYSLRPVSSADAQFIVDIRTADAERNKFIHKISSDVSAQEKWIESYLARPNDYYFVIENVLTRQSEGLIGIYNIENGKGEWGRWVIGKDSFAATESLDLICQAAFDFIGLSEIFCRTIQDNVAVASFHNSAKERLRTILPDFLELDGKKYTAVEHCIDVDYYRSELSFFLQKRAQKIFERNLKNLIGDFEFHHIGIACFDFDREYAAFKMLGYRRESLDFRDDEQGIYGRFLTAENQPRLELLKNTENSHTLDMWLKNKAKMYHFAYAVSDFDRAVCRLTDIGAKIIRPAAQSVYFGKRICFLILPNMFVFEIVEKQ